MMFEGKYIQNERMKKKSENERDAVSGRRIMSRRDVQGTILW